MNQFSLKRKKQEVELLATRSPKQRTAESMKQRADDPEREARFENVTMDRVKSITETIRGSKDIQKAFSAAEKAGIEDLKTISKTPKVAETTIQQQVVKWFAWTYPETYKTGALFAVPNEGKRTRATASRMKAEGLFRGAWDLILLLPRGGFHGACFEMKAKGGKLTPEQLAWGRARILDGYFCDVFFSYEQAVQGIEQYMNLKK